MKKMLSVLLLILALTALTVPSLAAGSEDLSSEAVVVATAEEAEAKVVSTKAIAAAITIGVAAAAGAFAMAMAICKSTDGIARQPEAEGKIRTTMMLGLVFVETAIIYALIVAILIIFVL